MTHLKRKSAFTLVELIVVVTILSILATLAFISFQGFTVTSRDSTRLSNVTWLNRLLDYYKLKNDSYPNPDSSIALTASGNLIGYQWNAGQSVFIAIWYSHDGLDPLDNTPYTYYTLRNGNAMQLLAFMEKQSSTNLGIIPQWYADLSTRYPAVYGNKLGIITDSDNVPAQSITGATDVDITKTTDTFKAHVSNTEFYEWNWDSLRYSVPLSSCQRLADANQAGPSGYYTIYPIDGMELEVYCNFETEGEGLTMVARSVDDPVFDGTPFGWFVNRGTPQDDANPYSLGSAITEIPFQKIYLGVYQWSKTLTWWVTTLEVTDIDLFDGSYTNTAKAVDNCSGIPIIIQLDHDANPGTPRVPYPLADSCLAFSYWGKFWSIESYFLSNNPAATNDWLNRRRYWASFPEEWIIFIK